jgi:hypothetical protein
MGQLETAAANVFNKQPTREYVRIQEPLRLSLKPLNELGLIEHGGTELY